MDLKENYFWNEFCTINCDMLSFFNERFKLCQDLLNDLRLKSWALDRYAPAENKPLEDLRNRTAVATNNIGHARRILDEIVSTGFNQSVVDCERARNLRRLIDSIVVGTSDLEISLSQEALRAKSQLAQTKDYKIFQIEPELVRAVRSLFDEASSVIFGRSYNVPETPIPMPVFWPRSDYEYLTNSFAIAVPLSLMHGRRYHLGAPIPHEIAHAKLAGIGYFYSKMMRPDNDAEKRRSENHLERFIPESTHETLSEMCSLEEEFYLDLKMNVGEIYKQLYRKYANDDFCLRQSQAAAQLHEIICDVVSVTVAGPADVFWCGSVWTDLCGDSTHDILNHLEDITHPPAAIRMEYLLEHLEETGGGRMAFFLKEQARGLTKWRYYPDRATLSDRYFQILRKYRKRISALVGKLIMERPTSERWNALIETYERCQDHELRSVESDLNAYELVNLLWFRRGDAFLRWKKSPESKTYLEELRREEPFFEDIRRRLESTRTDQ